MDEGCGGGSESSVVMAEADDVTDLVSSGWERSNSSLFVNCSRSATCYQGATPTPQKLSMVASAIVIPDVDINECLNLLQQFHLSFNASSIMWTRILDQLAKEATVTFFLRSVESSFVTFAMGAAMT